MPAQPNQSLSLGLACLQALSSADRPVGSRELARMLDIEPTRSNRLLGTLASLGMAQQNADRKYTVGPAIHVLATQALKASGLLSAALPHVRELLTEDLSVVLGVLWQGRVCYILHAEPGQPLEQSISARHLFPAAVSTIGRPILACSDPAETDAALKAAEEDGRAISRTKLNKELDRVRKDGYAYRKNADRSSVGVRIGTPGVAGLAFIGRFSRRSVSRLAQVLQQAADAIYSDMKGN